jgi:hypothetical protein
MEPFEVPSTVEATSVMSEAKSALSDRAYGTENALLRGLTFIAALGGMLGHDNAVIAAPPSNPNPES